MEDGRSVIIVPDALSIDYRPMEAADVGVMPSAHQGEDDEVRRRIAHLGSSAWLALDGARHIGQLQFRQFEAGIRSPNGVGDPLWWLDFGEHAPALDSSTLAVCCCHVGQVDNTAHRDERYIGRGIGSALLDHFLGWARDRRFAAVIAKATADRRAVMEFLGGFPVGVYQARGFTITAQWVDHDLERALRQRGLAADSDRDCSTVACCVLPLR